MVNESAYRRGAAASASFIGPPSHPWQIVQAIAGHWHTMAAHAPLRVAPSPGEAALPLRTHSSTSPAWNFHSRPTLWAGMPFSAIHTPAIVLAAGRSARLPVLSRSLLQAFRAFSLALTAYRNAPGDES